VISSVATPIDGQVFARGGASRAIRSCSRRRSRMTLQMNMVSGEVAGMHVVRKAAEQLDGRV
jgi:hypothetical protein